MYKLCELRLSVGKSDGTKGKDRKEGINVPETLPTRTLSIADTVK